MTITSTYYLVLAAGIFTIGAVGLLVRRNVIVMFMCVELMLNAVNLTFVSFARELNDIRGQVLVFFTLVVAAAEVAVGLGIIVAIFRRRRGATADDLDLLQGRRSVTERDILDLVWIVPALPLLGAAVLLLFGKRIGEPVAGWIATGLMGLAFIWSIVTFVAMINLPSEARVNVVTLWNWLPAGQLHVNMGFYTDPLSVTWILLVTGVGSLIHLYSIGYMHGDSRYSRFFAYMNLFAASMLILVLGSSFLVTFLGWEGVGLCVVPPRVVLVRAQLGRGGREESIRHQPRRRRRLPARDVPHLRLVPHARLHRARRRREVRVVGDRHRDRVAAPRRRGRKERADTTSSLAARRHGRTHAGVGADPRGHHGDGRHLPACAARTRSST